MQGPRSKNSSSLSQANTHTHTVPLQCEVVRAVAIGAIILEREISQVACEIVIGIGTVVASDVSQD